MKRVFIALAMKRVLIVTAVALAASFAAAHAARQASASVAPDAPEEVRHGIDAGNARWAEAWAKGDASILASLFADDGVQLAGNGKTFKGPREIREHMAAVLKATGPGVKVTVTTARVKLARLFT